MTLKDWTSQTHTLPPTLSTEVELTSALIENSHHEMKRLEQLKNERKQPVTTFPLLKTPQRPHDLSAL